MENTDIFKLQQARSFGDTLAATFRFFKISFTRLIKSYVLILGPFILLTSISFFSYMSQLFKMIDIGRGGTANQLQGPQFYSSMGLSLLFSWITSLLLYTMLQLVIFNHSRIYEEKGIDGITVKAVWEKTRKDFWKILGTLIGLGLLFILSYVPIFVFMTFSPVLMGIYAFAFIFFIIYFIITFSIVPVIRVYENIGFFKSLKRSMSLMKGFWWKTFGLYFVISILIFFLLFIPMYASSMIYFFKDINQLNTDPNNFLTSVLPLFSVIYLFAGLLIYSLIVLASNIQYLNIIEQKEGSSLTEKVEELGTEVSS